LLTADASKKHPFPCPTTYRVALTNYLEITALPTTQLLKEFAQYAHDDAEKTKLQLMGSASNEGKVSRFRMTTLEGGSGHFSIHSEAIYFELFFSKFFALFYQSEYRVEPFTINTDSSQPFVVQSNMTMLKTAAFREIYSYCLQNFTSIGVSNDWKKLKGKKFSSW
jgi:hypothetical protein